MIENVWPITPKRNPTRNFLDSFAHRLRVVPGFCNVCGRITVYDTSQTNYREYVPCARCKSVNRQRQISSVLLAEVFQARGKIKRIPSKQKEDSIFQELEQRQASKMSCEPPFLASVQSLPKDLVVWNAETTRALHTHLSDHLRENYICSEYISPSMQSGEWRDGIMHVDIQKTHFADESIDYILSSDVLEHVPDPIQALRESFRVLKVGGAHIFTAPFYHHRFTIEKRSVVLNDGSIHHLMQPWFHSDPVRPSEGALVFNIFAPELLCDIEKLGFEARLLILHSPLNGIYGNNGIVIIARKMLSPDYARDWIFG